jgi:hypothetical protein
VQPQADATVVYEGKSYCLRAQHGLLFFRDARRNREDFTLAAGSPLPEDADLETFFVTALEDGNIARYVLLNYRDHHRRDMPLFFKPDGTGFCRESWNRDDVHFEHDLSLHDWMEGAASTLQGTVREIFDHAVAPQLERLPWPADRNWPLSFSGGTREQLSEIIGAAAALEPPLREGGRILRISCQAESPFSRAGVYTVEAEAGQVRTFFDEDTGERVRHEYWPPELAVTNRFWTLCDWAVDVITPGGIYWDILDRGRGRLSESPHARDFSLQFIVSKLPEVAAAQATVRNWALSRWSIDTVESVLRDEKVADFPIREPD